MDTIKINKRDTKMIAHRGLSGIERENTNSAFVAAGNRSYFGIECDVYKTIDGKYLVFHDHNTVRLAIDNLEVEKTTFDCLRGLLLTDTGGIKGRSDLRIPTMKEYIQICKKYDKVSVIELKSSFSREDISEMMSIVKDEGQLDDTIFISFNMDNLIFLREISENQPAQYLILTYKEDIIETLLKYKLDLDIRYNQLTAGNIKTLHDANIKINCWTCDDWQKAEELAALGVEYITTNILE